MKTYTKEELAEILRKHKLWLANGDGGERANLSYADLRNAALSYANLCYANLSCADLRGANLSDADLRGANLSYANLSGAALSYANLCYANLSCADLRGANLSYADLRNADLHDADLRGANLSGAALSYANLCNADLRGANMNDTKNVIAPIACPEAGAFIGWKKCFGGLIVELEICADAKRSSAAGRKCRCDKAKVLSIVSPDGISAKKAVSEFDADFVYRVGEIVSVDDFDDNRWNECAPGIHFFITRQEAVDY